MKKLLLFIILYISGYQGFCQQFIDSNAQARSTDVFHSIQVSQVFEIYLTQGNKETLAVSAGDKKYLSQIKTEVKNGKLRIWHDGGNIHDWNTAKMKLKVYISFIHLDDIKISKGCEVHMVGDWEDKSLKKRLLDDISEGE